MAMNEYAGDEYGGNGNYTYILKGVPDYASSGDPQFPSRHMAVGEKANLEAIHLCDIEIVARERKATDPANHITVKTACERIQSARKQRP
jgi:hypothetical protein